MVGSALLFAAMGAAVKVASASLPNAMLVFARSTLGLLALLPWLVRLGPRNLATRHLREHVVRGLAGLAAALFAAVAQVGVRRLTRTEPSSRIVFYFGVISTAVSALPLVREWRMPAPPLWLTLVALGLLATAGQLLLTEAYAFAPAARVGPFIYTSVAFAGLFDWWLFGKPPDAFTAAGAVLIAAAGLVVLRLGGETLPPPER